MPDYDVIVVGAGPAGATAGHELAKNGLSVLILEKEKFPRYKPCGGGLSLKIDKIITFSIKETIEATVKGAYCSFKQKEGLYLLSERPVAYMIMRDRFDSLLVSEAIKAGATFIDGSRVKGVSNARHGYDVFVDGNVYNCKYLIGADGVNGVVRRFIHPRAKRSIAASIEAEIPVDQRSIGNHDHYIHIDFGIIPYGYAWIFPKKGLLSTGLAGFRGAVKEPKRYLNKFIKGHDRISRIEGYRWRGYPIPLFRNQEHLTKGRVMLVGDAGNLVDPFFGEGIYYAIRSAQIASTVISEAIKKGGIDLTRYDILLGAELYPEFRAAQQISQFVYTFPRMWYDVLSDRPELAEKYYNVLRGESRYPIFLKEIKAIAGSLMKSAIKKGLLHLFR